MVFRSLLMAGVSALFLSACGQASVSPSTSIVPDAAEPSTLTIDYEKFTLDNGPVSYTHLTLPTIYSV